MNFKEIPIFVDKKNSKKIAREKILKVFNDVSLQFYGKDKTKFKVPNLFCEIRTHRAVLEDKSDYQKYFEIHFDKIVNDIQPVLRGYFSKETYKLQIVYPKGFILELKNGMRSNFEEPYKTLKQAFIDSKAIVN